MCDALERVPGVLGVEAHGDEAVDRDRRTARRRSARWRWRSTSREIKVRELTLRTPTLDDVFLELTGNRMAETTSDARPEEASVHDRP